jgi:hypothetical protein
MLYAALIQKVIKNEWLRCQFCDIIGRLICVQSDDNKGISKWYYIERFLYQLCVKVNITFDNKTNTLTQDLLSAIKPSELALFHPKQKSTKSQIAEKFDYLSNITKRLQNEIQQNKQQIENLTLVKESELEEVKKQVERITTLHNQLTSMASGEQHINYTAERQSIEEQILKLTSERTNICALLQQIDISLLDQIKKSLPTLFDNTTGTIDERKKKS